MRKGFTIIELLVVVAITATLAAILLPVFARVREKSREATCLSNQRQLVYAVLMRAQDRGEVFPGIDTVWEDVEMPKAVLHCPTQAVEDIPNGNSYGYVAAISGRPMGKVHYPQNQPVTGDCLPPASNVLMTVGDFDRRHMDKGVVSYADGHVELIGAVSTFGGADLMIREPYGQFQLGNNDYWNFEATGLIEPRTFYYRADARFVPNTDSADYNFRYPGGMGYAYAPHLWFQRWDNPFINMMSHLNSPVHMTLSRPLVGVPECPSSLPVKGWVLGFNYGAGGDNSTASDHHQSITVYDDEDSVIAKLYYEDGIKTPNTAFDEVLTFNGQEFFDKYPYQEFTFNQFWWQYGDINYDPMSGNPWPEVGYDYNCWTWGIAKNRIEFVARDGKVYMYWSDLYLGTMEYLVSADAANWDRPARLELDYYSDGNTYSWGWSMAVGNLTYYYF
jgi:prepilin-type N-terminal cleavage/methylation domain-containing protein/prepilin-type processing-associated H-X9-DG protein